MALTINMKSLHLVGGVDNSLEIKLQLSVNIAVSGLDSVQCSCHHHQDHSSDTLQLLEISLKRE